ncbi:ABC transporter permease [Sphingobacterium suaedae]|uniref:ABC transporter permease n=1 Tax=Sphingobacterium suaedae TaxID=1686402 RepID=A0ABW5KHF0_9SPHI
MNGLKLTLRKLWKSKLFTGLNILGLAIGISACWMVFRIVNYEFSFDKSHPEKEQIYKVYMQYIDKEGTHDFDGIPMPLFRYIKDNFPEVDLTVPLFKRSVEQIISSSAHDHAPAFIDQDQIFATSPDYFTMVPYVWLAGNATHAFTRVNEVVLTESRAKLYFPTLNIQDVVGKALKYDTTTYTITGVVQDLSKPSSFVGKEFLSMPHQDPNIDNWDFHFSNNQLFIKLRRDTDAAPMLQALAKKMDEIRSVSYKHKDEREFFALAPLSSLHFNAAIQNHVDKKILYGLVGIGGFLLLLACINYVNLSTAQVPYRAKEIGIRKTLGEQPSHITLNFLLETFLVSVLAWILSWPLTRMLAMALQDYIPADINLYADDLAVTGFIGALLLFITLISSLYPAFLINRLQVADVIKIKGAGKLSLGSLSLRKILIVLQFVIAQVFVIATFVVGLQLKHMLSSHVGFEKEAVLNMRVPNRGFEKATADPFLLKQALQRYSDISHVSLGHRPMEPSYWGNYIFKHGDAKENGFGIQMKYADPDYLDLFHINLLAGRKPTLADSTTGILLNESAIQLLGFKTPEEAISKQVELMEQTWQIIGVMENFNSRNLRNQINPISLVTTNKRGPLTTFNIKLSGDVKQWNTALENIEKEWKKIYPYAAFRFEFYDQEIKNLYQTDFRLAKIINLSTVVTLLLGCLGLIGLVTLTAYQRTKEIGIRKVLGSSVLGIVGLLSRDYIKLIGLAILIACPIAWWSADKWLSDFAYRINMEWWMLLTAGVSTALIALTSVSYQAIKAARANPVNSLRDE